MSEVHWAKWTSERMRLAQFTAGQRVAERVLRPSTAMRALRSPTEPRAGPDKAVTVDPHRITPRPPTPRDGESQHPTPPLPPRTHPPTPSRPRGRTTCTPPGRGRRGGGCGRRGRGRGRSRRCSGGRGRGGGRSSRRSSSGLGGLRGLRGSRGRGSGLCWRLRGRGSSRRGLGRSGSGGWSCRLGGSSGTCGAIRGDHRQSRAVSAHLGRSTLRLPRPDRGHGGPIASESKCVGQPGPSATLKRIATARSH